MANRDDVFLPRTSSRIRPTPRSTGATTGARDLGRARGKGRRVRGRRRHTAARSRALGEVLKDRSPDCLVIAVRAPQLGRVLSGGAPGPHKIQGIGAGFVPQVLNRDVIDEVDHRGRRGRDPNRPAHSPATRACSPASRAAPRCGRRSRSPPGRSLAASGSSRSCRTREKDTSRPRSLPRSHWWRAAQVNGAGEGSGEERRTASGPELWRVPFRQTP